MHTITPADMTLSAHFHATALKSRLRQPLKKWCDECGKRLTYNTLQYDQVDPGDPQRRIMRVCASCLIDRKARRAAIVLARAGLSVEHIIAEIERAVARFTTAYASQLEPQSQDTAAVTP